MFRVGLQACLSWKAKRGHEMPGKERTGRHFLTAVGPARSGCERADGLLEAKKDSSALPKTVAKRQVERQQKSNAKARRNNSPFRGHKWPLFHQNLWTKVWVKTLPLATPPSP